ncbi:MAG: hypothetical protein J0I20_10795 [Chloroflexi bacterium]|nr:hypothetical protein [Chloroflexota bacterium]OJV94433.1 MAG: hypothetical protein BGO39_21995 [Chloroflexi bacterium 54-19]
MPATKTILEIIEISGFMLVAGSVPLVLRRFQRLNLGFRLLYDALFLALFAAMVLSVSPAFDKLPGILLLAGFVAILVTFNWYVRNSTVGK